MREALAEIDPALAAVHAATPTFPWRVSPGGFPALVKMVVGQQVSTASANAIWSRLEAGLGDVSPGHVLAHDEDGLKAFGLSRPKARYTLSLAQAHLDRHPAFERLSHLDDPSAAAALTSLKGIGPWTAEIYLMFCEGRLDVFPAGDVALQSAIGWIDRAPVRPDTAGAYARSEAWKPYRSAAAHLLWAWYGGIKRGEIAPP